MAFTLSVLQIGTETVWTNWATGVVHWFAFFKIYPRVETSVITRVLA